MSSPSLEERSGSRQSASHRNPASSQTTNNDLNTPPLRSSANSPSDYTSSGNNSGFNTFNRLSAGGNGQFSRGEHHYQKTEQQQQLLEQQNGNRGLGIAQNADHPYRILISEGEGGTGAEAGTALQTTPSCRPALPGALSPAYPQGPLEGSPPFGGKSFQSSLTPLDTLAARARREGSDGNSAVYGAGSSANLSNGSLAMSNSMSISALSDNDFGSIRSFVSPPPANAGVLGSAGGHALIHSASSEGHHGLRANAGSSSPSSHQDHQYRPIPAMSHLSSPSFGHHSDSSRNHPFTDASAVLSPLDMATSYHGREDGQRSHSGDRPASQDGRSGTGGGEREGADSVGPTISGTHRQDLRRQQHEDQSQRQRDDPSSHSHGNQAERPRERDPPSVDHRGFSSMDSQGPAGWRESEASYDSLQSRTESMHHSQRSPTSVDSQYQSAHSDHYKDGLPPIFGRSNFAPYLESDLHQQQQHQHQAQGYTPQYHQQHHHLQQPSHQQSQQHLSPSAYQHLIHSEQQPSLPVNGSSAQQPLPASISQPQLSAQMLQQQQQFAHQNLPPSRPESPEFSIFVGDLSPDLREEDLVAQFLNPPPWPPSHPFAIAHAHALQAKGHYGPPPRIAPRPFTSCKSSKIMIDPANRSSRGFGFVRFSTEDDCNRALIEMQGVVMVPANGASPGRPLRVCTATPKNRHASGGVSGGLETQAPPGMTHSLSGVNLYSGPGRTATMTSSGPLSSPTSAGGYSLHTGLGVRGGQPPDMLQRAGIPQGYQQPPQLMPPQPASIEPSPLSAPFGHSPSMASSTVSALPPGAGLASLVPSSSSFDPSNTTVFVGGLSSLISEDTLKTFFVPFGEITYVKIPPGKGCGFVQFVRKADAERAIERMQGFPIGGGRIRLSWGRSQGDKAAAAAVTAAQRAAQLGQLAGLAGLSGLSQSQLAQLAGLSKAINAQTVRADPHYQQPGMGPDLNSALLRQLTAAASGLAAESAPSSASQARPTYPEYSVGYGGGGDSREDVDSDLDLRAAFEGMGFNPGSQSSHIPQVERFESMERYGDRGRSQSHHPSLEQPRRNSPYTLVQSSKFAPFSPQDSPIGHASNLPQDERGDEDMSRWNQY